MASTNEFVCKQGATFTLMVDAVEGDLTGYSCEADFKVYENGSPKGEVIGTFAPVYSASVEGGGPGWYLTLTATQTKDLVVREYVADARLAKGGEVVMTQNIIFEVSPGITRR